MKRLAALALVGALSACGRSIDLGFQDGGIVGGGACTLDGDCASGQTCQAGTCTSPGICGNALTSCVTHGLAVCSDSCPGSCGALQTCCTDNGFGACQCFCGVSCSGPTCAVAGTDPGPLITGCGSDADCECGETCTSGVCRVGVATVACQLDQDCAALGGSCEQDTCIAGRCVPAAWQCQNDRECNVGDQGFACRSGSCTCVSHSGQNCATDADCAACGGETCSLGVCGTRTTTGTNSTGGNSAGATSTAGTTGTSGATATSTATTGATTGSSGSTGSACTCNTDADCNDAFHQGLICSGGFCAPGPNSASATSSTGACAQATGTSSSTTGTTGTVSTSTGTSGST